MKGYIWKGMIWEIACFLIYKIKYVCNGETNICKDKWRRYDLCMYGKIHGRRYWGGFVKVCFPYWVQNLYIMENELHYIFQNIMSDCVHKSSLSISFYFSFFVYTIAFGILKYSLPQVFNFFSFSLCTHTFILSKGNFSQPRFHNKPVNIQH